MYNIVNLLNATNDKFYVVYVTKNHNKIILGMFHPMEVSRITWGKNLGQKETFVLILPLPLTSYKWMESPEPHVPHKLLVESANADETLHSI